jgi:nickel/cobalt transporter (NicO) family protein
VKPAAVASIAFNVTIVAVAAALVLLTSALATAETQVHPFGIRPPEPSGFTGWIVAEQSRFYRALSGLIRAAKTDGSALWGLLGISFIYGIFHAAGPGHGKAVISSYLVANEETWRRGIALSFASALLQAITAIVIVGVAAVLIGATAKMMGDTVRVIEIASYTLIVLLGARLFWVKGRGFVRTWHEVRSGFKAESTAHQHHDHAHRRHPADASGHDHAHGHDHHHDDQDDSALPWGHAHGPEPEELAGPGGWHRGLAAIVAVGLRPCSGAIIVLVFALAQGLFLAGVASTIVMGLGTAITVAAIATLAVAARTAAKRVAATRPGYGSLALRGIESAAAVLVMAFGAFLLTGYMASERTGLF